MHILFLFLDGIGLGENDPTINPFAVAETPHLLALSGGQRWLKSAKRVETERSIFVPTDPTLGVDGRPQSASGQATILTGLNVPAQLSYHYGPKPNQAIAELVRSESLIIKLVESGSEVTLINAYPPRFFDGITSGKHLLSSVQLAFDVAGLPLFDKEALVRGDAMSADFTGDGWRQQLGIKDAPVYEPEQAGAHLATLAKRRNFTFFDHWPTDIIGHRGTVEEAVAHLEQLDAVMSGLLDAWDDEEGLIVLTSDHGNMEDLSRRGHTTNLVPTVVVGNARRPFVAGLSDLTHFALPILSYLDGMHAE